MNLISEALRLTLAVPLLSYYTLLFHLFFALQIQVQVYKKFNKCIYVSTHSPGPTTDYLFY